MEELVELTSWRGQSYNATTCTVCGYGLFSSAIGATTPSTCKLCEAGSYASFDSVTVCTLCPAGKFLPKTGSSSSAQCLECNAGEYSEFSGSANCTECAAGTSCDITGANSNSSCVLCPIGKTSAPGAAACRKCTALESCYNWECLAGQYRKGDICSSCSKCKYANASNIRCTSYSDAQCAPCSGSLCGSVQSSITLAGFDTTADFEIYGAVAFKASVAIVIGGGTLSEQVIISEVCDSIGCSTLRRNMQSRRSASDVSVTFQVFTTDDPSKIAAKVKASNFSSFVAASISQETNRTVNASSASIQSTQCQTGYYQNSASDCRPCTVCSAYLVQCGSSTDAVCSTTSQITVIVASVAAVVGFLLFLVVGGVYRWNEVKKRAEISRRLMSLSDEEFHPGQTKIEENDLPWVLRLRYTAKSVLGRGAFGVVLEAEDKSGKAVAIKLVFPVGKEFDKEELKGLLREVLLA